MSYPTTRKYPRTLAEAWPREHANPITFYPGTGYSTVIRACVCIIAAAVIGWLAAQGV